MPGLDGIELSKFIFEHELCTKVVFLSGHKDFDYAQSAILYNVSQYVLKPTSPEELLRAVKSASEQAEKRRQNDMRLRLLEAELGKRQLIMDDNNIILGEFDRTSITRRILEQ
jgi:two-component system response regulator YesN